MKENYRVHFKSEMLIMQAEMEAGEQKGMAGVTYK